MELLVQTQKQALTDDGRTRILTNLDPWDPDVAFASCDLGISFPELGSVSMREPSALRSRLGLPVERDQKFAAHLEFQLP